MRRLLLAVGVAILLAPVTGYAQWRWGGCPTCGVVSYIDYPRDGARIRAEQLAFFGWGFECAGGDVTDRVEVYYQDDDGFYRYLKQTDPWLWTGVPRPDVKAAFLGGCAMDTWTGWHKYIEGRVPLGTRRFAINVWKGPYVQTHIRTLTIF